MKRRDFFKIVTGFVAGIFATSAKSKYSCSASMSGHPSAESSVGPNWNALGCKDCFRECGQFDDCKADIKKRVFLNFSLDN